MAMGERQLIPLLLAAAGLFVGCANQQRAHVPVRPLVQEVLGEQAYTDLESLPFKVDMVDVFRASEYVPAIVESCIALGVPRLWIQVGVIHKAAVQHAQAAGITVVMNRCMWRDYSQLCGQAK
jgi:predicted CoA-binding protein